MNSSRQVLGKPGFFLNECLVDEQLSRSCRQLHGSPFLYLLLQGSKVPLHAINTDGQAVLQREVLRVLCQYCGVIPMEREVFTHKHSDSDYATEPEALIVAVPQSKCEPASLEAGTQVHHAEHLHAVRRDGVFLLNHADPAEAEGFD